MSLKLPAKIAVTALTLCIGIFTSAQADPAQTGSGQTGSAQTGSGQKLTGTLTNGTTRKPASGDDVILIKLAQGMEEAARTRADASGRTSG